MYKRQAENTGINLEWTELLAGDKAVKETGSPLPEETMQTLRTAELAMKGPLGTPVGTGIRSLNVALRQGLDLYACIRPVRHLSLIHIYLDTDDQQHGRSDTA